MLMDCVGFGSSLVVDLKGDVKIHLHHVQGDAWTWSVYLYTICEGLGYGPLVVRSDALRIGDTIIPFDRIEGVSPETGKWALIRAQF